MGSANGADKMRILLAATAASVLLSAGAASAATITETYDFSASNFVLYGGTGTPPVGPISGWFTVTFDPTVQQFNVGTVTGSINIPYDVGLVFSFNPFAGNLMIIGASPSGAAAASAGTADFILDFSGALADPQQRQLVVTQGAGIFGTEDVSITIRDGAGGVPEPATWAMMIAGLGLAGMSLRACRKLAAV